MGEGLKLLQNLDINILYFIHQHLQNSFLDDIMKFVSIFGNWAAIWIIIILPLLFIKKYRHIGITAAIALILTIVLGEGIIKHIVHRQRPFMAISDIILLIKKPITYSFPSGHTASSFAVAGVLSYYFKKYRTYFWILAALIAFSRLYLFVHYPSDVAIGILLGVFCYKLAIYLYQKIIKKNKNE